MEFVKVGTGSLCLAGLADICGGCLCACTLNSMVPPLSPGYGPRGVEDLLGGLLPKPSLGLCGETSRGKGFVGKAKDWEAPPRERPLGCEHTLQVGWGLSSL